MFIKGITYIYIKTMSAEENISVDFTLESIQERDGRFFFKAKSLSKDFECEDGLKSLARASINKDLVWKHRHPLDTLNKESHIYGRVHESKLENGHIETIYEAYNHTPKHLAFIELVKERVKAEDPLGISMHYRRYTNSIGKIIHYDVFEHSGTPIPACQTCKTISLEIKKMPDNIDKEEIKDEELEVDKDLEILKKIEELEGLLNSKTEKLEEYKVKIESLELEMKKKSEEIDEKNKDTQTVEERVLELELEISYLKKKPILDKLLELVEIDEKQLEWLKTQEREYLDGRFKEAKLQAESKPHTQTIDESADKNINKTDKEFEEKEGETKVTFDKFTKYLKLNNKKKE